MLKFNTWPPEVGQVEWSEYSQHALHNGPMTVTAPRRTTEGVKGLSGLGRNVGSLLVENVQAGTDVAQIAEELTQGWSVGARTVFMNGISEGAGMGDMSQAQ